ncbi:hypothetical protein [Aquirufa antheringensis]|jgi:hypothetical protein|uniref:hypothetical protein n=1 Tax=Aquirufa antheringensis TaxID=2516559 RepID=UPI001032A5B7|nr:hypothetical protein [Aquirufa antheringensis]TBH72868.1 hypothetical protein EWU21_02850 [Aquirufa antheringensis]
MKNRYPTYVVAILFACTLFSTSCSKDPAATFVPANTTYTLLNSNGFLAFEDQVAFQAYVENFQKNPSDPVILRDIQFLESQSTELRKLDSVSLSQMAETGDLTGYEHMLKLVGDDDDKSLQPLVDDPILSRLINKDGLIQIGELVYQVNPSKVFQIRIADFEQTKATFLTSPEKVAQATVYRSQSASAIKNTTSKMLNKVESNSVTYENPGQGTCRFTAEVYLLDLGFYRKLAVRVKHEWRQRFWFTYYWGNSSAAMSMEGDINFLEYYTPFTKHYSVSTNDDYKIETVIDETFNYVPLNWTTNVGTAVCRGRNGLTYSLHF